MNSAARPDAAAIRQARADNPKMRERDLATQLGISEAEFVAAWCGAAGVEQRSVLTNRRRNFR